MIRIVEQEHVARMDIGVEEFGDRARREGERADMDRHMLRLGDQPPVEIADRGREIAARIENLRIGGAQHRLAHLGDDRQQPMLDHRDDDRVDARIVPSRAHGCSSASGNLRVSSSCTALPWYHCGRGGNLPTARTISSMRWSISA